MADVRFGLIGVNGIGRTHRRALEGMDDVKITAVCDIVEEWAKDAGEQYECPWFVDYHDLVVRDDIDIVSVLTPHYLHAPMAIAAAENGKHVFVEKPMCISVSEADAMIEAAKTNNVKLGVCHNQRSARPYRLMKKMIEAGEIGELWRVVMLACGVRTQAYYATGEWRGKWGTEGGGVLINQHVHDIDTLQYLVGKPTLAAGNIQTICHDIAVEDLATAFIHFDNGVDGLFQTSNIDGATFNGIQIAGNKGILVSSGGLRIGRPEMPSDQFVRENPEKFAKAEVTWEDLEPEEGPSGHPAMIRDMIAAVVDDREPEVHGEEGRTAIEILNAIILSAKRQKMVPIPVDRAEYDELLAELRADEQ
jgi:predicted dehydrogenase